MKKLIKKIVPRRRDITPHIIRPFNQFLKKEASGSLVLMGATLVALVWANSGISETYHRLWQTHLGVTLGQWQVELSLREWINEGLMCIFFFIVGLEIKREILVGELSSPKKALLPVAAALGGMIVPAGIYYLINRGQIGITGWGIPMATDIAFALGVLYVLGPRVPTGLKVFLSALAIADDLGAVAVIALFYSKGIVVQNLLISLAIVVIIGIASYFWVRNTLFYAIMSILLWLSIIGSGVHPTVAGIIVAMFIPAKGRIDTDSFLREVNGYLQIFSCPTDGCGETILINQQHLSAVQSIEMACHEVETPLQRLEHALHPWVAYVVVPLFALANAGLSLKGMNVTALVGSDVTVGIFLGLLFGKSLGISIFTYLAVRVGLSELPERVGWRHVVGVSMLAGIGFTMSLFIAMLSFKDQALLTQAKFGVFGASLLAGLVGALWLAVVTRQKGKED